MGRKEQVTSTSIKKKKIIIISRIYYTKLAKHAMKIACTDQLRLTSTPIVVSTKYHFVEMCEIFIIRVGGLRERDYQLAAQKRNEACRRFDNNCQTAKYFERESNLAQHFNSWSSRDNYCGDKLYDIKSKAERLRVRKNKLIKLLREEEAANRIEMNRSESSHVNKEQRNKHQESIEELKKKLETKRAERSLYYPNNYRCFRSFNDVSDSNTHLPRHYEKERHIDACRNSEVSMENTNLRNYSSDCQGRKENPENRHHGEKRHLQGHTMYGTNVDSFGHQPAKHTGERRHYEAAVDHTDKASDHAGDDDNASIMTTGSYFRDEKVNNNSSI